LQGTQAEIYQLILSGLRRRIDDADTWADKIETLRRARPIRLLQAATNPDLFNRTDIYYRLPRVDMPNPTLMDRLANYSARDTPAKSLAALELLARISSDGGKCVCWSNFIGNLDQFSALVRERLAIPCFQIDGRVPAGDEPSCDASSSSSSLRENPDDIDTRERIIERFLNTNGAAVLVTNPASCSESISLHRGCHSAIYLDRTYDCAQFLQSIDRIHRLGLPPDVTVEVHILLAIDDSQPTIDHLVDASLLAKEAVMLDLLEGAEVRPLYQHDDPATDAEGTDQDLDALLRYLLGETSELD
jgi:SNF2 family DNA or RNA helicase